MAADEQPLAGRNQRAKVEADDPAMADSRDRIETLADGDHAARLAREQEAFLGANPNWMTALEDFCAGWDAGLEAGRLEGAASEAVRIAVERLSNDPMRDPVLITYAEAARRLGTSEVALRTRVSRGEPALVACVVRTGRSVRFNAESLAKKFAPGRGRR